MRCRVVLLGLIAPGTHLNLATPVESFAAKKGALEAPPAEE
jgi:hypothetical protein